MGVRRETASRKAPVSEEATKGSFLLEEASDVK